jgi:hypothetical protein
MELKISDSMNRSANKEIKSNIEKNMKKRVFEDLLFIDLFFFAALVFAILPCLCRIKE